MAVEVEHIEEWIGADVFDPTGERIGKLDELYFRGDEAVVAEIKPGALSRKRLLVPLTGASASRGYLRIGVPATQVVEERSGGSGPEEADFAAFSDAYGAGYAVRGDELEASSARAERLRAAEEARARAEELEAEAARRRSEAENAGAHANAAGEQARAAEETHRAAAEDAARARADAEAAAAAQPGTTPER